MCITKSQFFFVQNSTNLSVHHDLATSNQPQRVYPVVVEVNPALNFAWPTVADPLRDKEQTQILSFQGNSFLISRPAIFRSFG